MKVSTLVAILVLSVHFIHAENNKKFEIQFIESEGVNLCNVVFYEKLPKPELIDKLVLFSLKACTNVDYSKNIVATAFLKDDALSKNKYSGQLVFVAKDKKILSWDEFTGTKTTKSDAGSYIIKIDEKERFVHPKSKFLSVSIVFAEKPTRKKAHDALIETTDKIKSRGLSATLYIFVGKKGNERTWKQVEDADGNFIFAEYDPQTELLSQNGKTLKNYKNSKPGK